MRRCLPRHTNGQSLVTVAVFALLLFLTMGLAIDGGLIYTQRRFMQNTADAACLSAADRLALSRTTTEATTAAQDVIANNLGVNAPGTLTYAAASDLYTPASGSGVDLAKGIEISGTDVRVALQSPANTTFMRVAGIASYNVAARAHCSATAGGGGTPFAVARWRGYRPSNTIDTDGLTTDKPLPQSATKGSMTVRDILQRTTVNNGIITQWPGWGNADYPGDPAAGTDLYSSPNSSIVATESAPGYETVLAGNEARPNVGGNSFTGPIVLDYRQTTFPQPLYYNGLTPSTSLNQYKDYATKYILGEYPGPWVIPGQELAYYSGVSAGLIQKPFTQRYNVNDIVTMLVYNGTVYDSPAFTISYPPSVPTNSVQSRPGNGLGSLVCSSGDTLDGSNTPTYGRKPPAKYKITITPQNYAPFKLRAFLSTDPVAWGKMQARWYSSSPSFDTGFVDMDINGAGPVQSLNVAGHTINFELQPSLTHDCTLLGLPVLDLPFRKDGAQTIYLEAQDTSTSKRHAVYAFINQDADTSDFYAYFPQIDIAYQPFEPGDKTSVQFKIEKANGASGGPGTALTVGGGGPSIGTIQWFNPANTTSSIATGATHNGVTVSVTKSGGNNNLNIDVSNSALTGKEYYVRIPVTYGSYTHYAWYYIAVRPPLGNSSSISEYVFALGYTRFKITYVDSNTIKGVAVSGLLNPEDTPAGFRPRLLPW